MRFKENFPKRAWGFTEEKWDKGLDAKGLIGLVYVIGQVTKCMKKISLIDEFYHTVLKEYSNF